MARVPKIPNVPPLPLQWRLYHQWFISRFEGDPKGAKFVYLEGSPENRVLASVGSMAFRTDGYEQNTVYVKENGTGKTGWRVLADGDGAGGGGSGAGVNLGFSADNTTWHEDLAVGDRYIRFAVSVNRPDEDSNAWTPGHRFVGDAGAPGVGTPGPAGQGVPQGGATADLLAKASGADYDTTWFTLGPQLPVPVLADAGKVAVVNAAGDGYELAMQTGGGGTDTNDYVDALTLGLSGQDLTVTLGRTGSLADIEQTVTLPAGGGLQPPGYGVPTYEEPHLSNIVGTPTDGQAVIYEESSGNLVFGTLPASSGEENVQVDWDEADTSSDAFIQNKPTIFSGNYNDLSNLPTIPPAYTDTQVDARIVLGVWPWALETNDSPIPATKLVNAPGEENIKADWDETDSSLDSFILNKPTIPSGNQLVPMTGSTGYVLTKTNSGREWQAVQAPAFSAYHEALGDYLGNTLLQAGTNVTLDYDDAQNTLTINAAGGGGGSEDGVVNAINLGHTGSNLRLTVGRTTGLSTLTSDIDLSTVVGIIGSLDMDVSGQELTITIERSIGSDLVATATLPSSTADDAYDWATEGNSDNIPLVKIPDLPAAQVTSGRFTSARIPFLSADFISSGTFSVGRVGTGTATSGHVLTSTGLASIPSWQAPQAGDDAFDWATEGNNDDLPIAKIPDIPGLKISSAISALWIPFLPASRITSGTFQAARFATGGSTGQVLTRTSTGQSWQDGIGDDAYPWATEGNDDDIPVSKIPDLNTAQITSGTFGTAFIPFLPASRISSETFAVARIPSLPASRVTSGEFQAARMAPGGSDGDLLTKSGAISLWGPLSAVSVFGAFQDGTDTEVVYDAATEKVQINYVGTGGGGTDTNDFVNALTLGVSGQDLTVTLGRTGSLADIEQMVTLPAGDPFDIHDDVTRGASISGTDRMIFSDEGSTGDPMSFIRADALADYMQGEIRINTSVITAGRLSISRGGTNAGNASDARDNLGLGSVATLDSGTGSGNVAVLSTGGLLSLNRLPVIPVSKGGTGATNGASALANLGAGTAATHNLSELTWSDFE